MKINIDIKKTAKDIVTELYNKESFDIDDIYQECTLAVDDIKLALVNEVKYILWCDINEL